ncbi:MAG: hypothetical protein VX372_00325 [Verrucomicrobiota bacterium]|nr:hypothetical protein [Verrucomicrobiota bacterium]
MSEILIEPLPANPFTPYDRESRWVAILALLATLFVHIGFILIVPEELVPRSHDVSDEVQKEVEAYEISLVDPAEARFVEASPEAPENEPDRMDQYSYRAQQAADDSPLSDAANKPKVDGEEDSQKILQGSLEQAPPLASGVYAPVARPGVDDGVQGGKLGAPNVVVLPQIAKPLPAPNFIQQDPASALGPGSRVDFVGEAPEVIEALDLDAPIDVYRPQSIVEQTQKVGDGKGGSLEAQPVPRVRPRLAPELITGPVMRSHASASRRGSLAIDATFSEFGEYQQQFYAAVQTGWYQEIEFFQPIDTSTRVQVRFTFYADGRVDKVKAVQTTASEIATFICETAIIKRSPFRPWTKEMVQVFGEQRTLDVVFHYR